MIIVSQELSCDCDQKVLRCSSLSLANEIWPQRLVSFLSQSSLVSDRRHHIWSHDHTADCQRGGEESPAVSERSEPCGRKEGSRSSVRNKRSNFYLVFFSVASVSCSLETHFSNWSITSVPFSSKNTDTDLVNSASLQLFNFPSVKETLRVYWSSNLRRTHGRESVC